MNCLNECERKSFLEHLARFLKLTLMGMFLWGKLKGKVNTEKAGVEKEHAITSIKSLA